jgi:hypothetical protein
MVVVLWGAIGTHSRSSNSSWVRLTRDEAMAVADMALMPFFLWDGWRKIRGCQQIDTHK